MSRRKQKSGWDKAKSRKRNKLGEQAKECAKLEHFFSTKTSVDPASSPDPGHTATASPDSESRAALSSSDPRHAEMVSSDSDSRADSSSIYQQLFMEIRDRYRDYIPVYTDGSRDGNDNFI